MRKTLVLLAAFCALSGFEQPQEEQLSEVVEKWRCVNDSDWSSQERTDAGYDDIPENEWIVTLTRGMLKHSKAAFGTVSVTGITHRAIFSVKGLERRWDFGENSEGEYGYAFVIDSQGGGAYYDFSGSETGEIVWPSQTYHCLLKRNLEEARRLAEKAEAARRQLEETERKRREAEVAEQLRSEMSESDALPIVRIEPQWPREALMDGTEGYVRFRVLIGTDGSVIDTEGIEAAGKDAQTLKDLGFYVERGARKEQGEQRGDIICEPGIPSLMDYVRDNWERRRQASAPAGESEAVRSAGC